MSTTTALPTHQPMYLPAPVGNLDAYIQQVNNLPMLDAEEEKSLAQRLQLHEDLAAAQKLILSHLRFVVHIARGYSGYGLALGDLIQEGNIGLMKAVKRFNPAHEVRLSTYAVHWIRAQMQEFIIRNWRVVKIATTKAQRKLFFNLRSSKKHLSWFKPEEAETVAEQLNVDKAVVYEMESRLTGQDISFDPSSDNDDENAQFAPAEYLQATNGDSAITIEHDDWQAQAQDMLPLALAKLDQRSQDILQRRWLTEDKATLQELADEYQVSAERIRQIETSAIKKLKLQMTELADT